MTKYTIRKQKKIRRVSHRLVTTC